MGTYDGPSYPRRSILKNRHGCQRLLFWGSQNCFLVFLDEPLRRYVMPTTVHVAQPSLLSETFFLESQYFYQVSLNGPLQRTTMLMIVRLAQPSQLSKTLFLRISRFLSSVPRLTFMTKCHAYDGLSCTTVMVVIDVLPESLKKISLVFHDGPLWRSSTFTMDRQWVQHEVLQL